MKTTSKLLSALALTGLLTTATPADAKTPVRAAAVASKQAKASAARTGQILPVGNTDSFGGINNPDKAAEDAWRAKSGGGYTIKNGICYSNTFARPDVFDLLIPNSVVYKGKCYTTQGLAQELAAEQGKPTPDQLEKQNQLLKQCDGKCTFSGINKTDGSISYMGVEGKAVVAGTISYNGTTNQSRSGESGAFPDSGGISWFYQK